MSGPNAGHANLVPAKPGEVRNPKGNNQFTARSEAAKVWDEIALEMRGDKRRIRKFLERVWDDGESGLPQAQKEILARTNPVVKEIDHRITNEREPVTVPTTDERLTAVAALVADTLH